MYNRHKAFTSQIMKKLTTFFTDPHNHQNKRRKEVEKKLTNKKVNSKTKQNVQLPDCIQTTNYEKKKQQKGFNRS